MVALTADRNTPRFEGDLLSSVLGASQAVFAGAILMRNAAGDLIEGATATGSFGVGVAQERVSSTTAGVTPIQYRAGIFRFANSAAGDLIAKADIGAVCYIVDDQTVAKANTKATASTAELREEFGAAAEAARELLREEAELARRRAERNTRGVSGGVQDELGLNLYDSAFGVGNQKKLADLFDFSIWSSEARSAINGITAAFVQLDSAGTLDEQIAAAETLRQRFKEAAEASGGISVQEDGALQAINALILGLQRLTAEQAKAQTALIEGNGRFPGFEAAQAALEYRFQEQQAIREVIAAEQERLAVQSAQEVVQNQILLFGRDSELVAQNRLAAEREIYAAALETAGATAQQVEQALAAWDAAVGFNAEAAGMPGLMSATASAAAGIAGNIWNAVSGMIALKNQQAEEARAWIADQQPGGSGYLANQYAMYGQGREAFNRQAGVNRSAAQIRNENRIATGAGRGGAGGGGAKSASEERDAVAELIEKLEREIELEREMDPVKKEMIRHREALKDATAAEREQVEALIVQREREKAATESLKWANEQAGDALVDALMGGADAGERLIDTLKRAVLQALLLGNGPLQGLFGGGIFGGGGGGGLFNGLFSGGSLFAGLAEGGMVYGPGGPTDDKVPRWLSPGEFVVNARATRRNRHLLEGLNAPGMATGGFVGGGAASSPTPMGSMTFAPVIDARGSNDPAAVEAAARKGMRQALDEYRRSGLSYDIRRQLDQPEVTRW
ncbi:MAG: hypothetical protein JXR75_00215 [Rhodobacteraceae bacterium]|nr:hypothetical protein [Paracoccaceae bacterium]